LEYAAPDTHPLHHDVFEIGVLRNNGEGDRPLELRMHGKADEYGSSIAFAIPRSRSAALTGHHPLSFRPHKRIGGIV
jgi:hypothetical protein